MPTRVGLKEIFLVHYTYKVCSTFGEDWSISHVKILTAVTRSWCN